MCRIIFIFFLLQTLLVDQVLAQLSVWVTGNSNVYVGQTHSYDAVFGPPVQLPPSQGYYYWAVSRGTIQSESRSTCSVTWNSVGSGYVEYTLEGYDNYYYNRLSVGVTQACAAPPIPSVGTFSLNPNTCAPRQLSYPNSPPSGIAWYWQTDPAGTSTANSTNTYNVTVAGYYYVRAYNPSANCWSTGTASQYVSPVQSAPAAPSTPTASTNTCDAKTLTRGAPPSGVTWYWQGTDANGTSVANSGTTYSAASSGYYYLRARNNTTGCWSINSASLLVSVNNPAVPPSPTVTTNACGPKTLSWNGSPPSGHSWYWQTSLSGTSTSFGGSSHTAHSSGLYYLRSYASGCWGQATAVSVTVDNPQIPSVELSVTSNTCGPQNVSVYPNNPGPPSGVNWYWQGTNPTGTSPTHDYTSPWQAVETGTYYLRARSSAGCWSTESQSIYAYINDPAPPSTPTVGTNSCGVKTISKSGSPPLNVGWYWQGTSASGTDYTSSTAIAASYTANTSGTYYLRARNSNGCWSFNSTPVTVTVNAIPAAPAVPTVSTNTCSTKTLSKVGTPPTGISWYWQGTNQNGEDYTSATATAATYSVSANGTSNHYIRARNNTTGCWSSATVRSVIVDNPPAPSANSFTYCEWSEMNLTTTGGTNLRWYNTSDQLLYTGRTYVVNLNPGSYTYRVKTLSNNNCESQTYANVTATVQANCDQYLNWTETKSYTMSGQNMVEGASSKNYLDGYGGLLQAQTKSYATNQVFASQPIKDTYNSNVLTTLSAPINSSTFVYKHRFMTNDLNGKYNAADFDQRTGTSAGVVDNPKPVANGGAGTLGWYYSNSNNLEPMTPTTAYPYARSYAPEGPDPTTSKSAGPGDQHKMGSGHEVLSERQKITNELSHYYSIRHHFITAPNNLTIPANPGYKYIGTDPNGEKVVSFVDADGRALASATLTGSNYDNWNYTFYNDLGQVVATVAPKGVITSSTALPQFVTWYKYDQLGRLIETTSIDEGTTRFVYSTDGKIRFSEDQVQRTASPKRFSYTNYDYLGRLIESGEYTSSGTNPYVFQPHTTATPSTYSILLLVDNTGFTGTSQKVAAQASRCTDYAFVYYDIQPTDAPATMGNLFGQVAKTENANTVTWYSYDEFGNLVKTWQRITSLANAIKTTDYTYDYVGNVTQVVYQKDVPEERFYHHYTYDVDQRLTEVHTSLNGTTKTIQAKYYYYLHGPLKRVELGGNKQGIDYVYNIDGSLKMINHADPTLDPGKDGISGTNLNFMKDVFGQALDYYTNDYVGVNGFNEGNFSLAGYDNQFGGAVKAIRWHNHVDSHVPRGYAFKYDNLYQMKDADFGNITGTNRSYGFSGATKYKESIGSYDKNGNIQNLVRNGKIDGSAMANYVYNYVANTNKLNTVNHNGAALLSYQYNAVGQMTRQTEGAKRMDVLYNAYGLTKEVQKYNNATFVGKTTYDYDDSGDLLRKAVYNASSQLQHETFYVSDASGTSLAIYEKDHTIAPATLRLTEVPVYGAGRVAIYKPQAATTFYELSDHLGNVRGVIGAPSTLTFSATLEDNGQAQITNPRVQEMAYFKNLSATEVQDVNMNHTAPSTYMPAPKYSAYLKWVSGINGQDASAKSVGPAIGLKVEPGDKINMETWVKWKKKTSYNRSSIVGSMASILGTSYVGSAPGLELLANATQVFQNGLALAPAAIYGDGTDPNQTTRPFAYLYYLLYDKSFNFITAGWKRVTTAGGFDPGNEALSSHEKLMIPTVTLTEPGYIYIFVANESENTEVWFDDLKITHERSVIVAGADYYPFGLPMENREITREDYRYGYQGQYSEENETTGWNEFDLRFYDAKIGRWLSGDPYGQYYSPYMAMNNNPHMSVDPNGGWSPYLTGALVGATAGTVAGAIFDDNFKSNWWMWTAGGAVAGVASVWGYGKIANSRWEKGYATIVDGKKTWHNRGWKTTGYTKYPKFQQWQERVFDLAVESDQVWDIAKEYALQFERKRKVKKLQFSFSEFWGSSGQWVSRNGKEEMWDVNRNWDWLDTPIFGKRGTYRVTHYQIFPDTPPPTILPDGTSATFASTPILDIKVTVRRQIHGRYGKTMSYGWKKIGPP